MTRPSLGDYATGDESESADLLRGIVAHWVPALGPSGLRLHDVSGRNNWGTLTNMDAATDWVIEGGQYALDFDGTNDYVDCGDTVSLPSTTNVDVTLSAWFRVTGKIGQFRTIFTRGKNNPGNTAIYEIGVSNSNVIYFYRAVPSGFITGVSAVSLNVLYHAVATIRSNGVLVIYLNGRQDGSASITAPFSTTPDTTFIGVDGTINANDKSYFIGQVFDVGVWNRVLSPNEVRSLYNLGCGGMLRRRRQRRAYISEAAFRAYWARHRTQLIGGGL